MRATGGQPLAKPHGSKFDSTIFHQFWKVKRVSIAKLQKDAKSKSSFFSTLVSMPGLSFHKVFSTACDEVELELAKAGLASVK